MTSASDRYQEKSDKKEHTMRNSSTPPLLRLEDICVKFGFVEALKSVNLSIQRQEVIAIVGDNGAGKSTLIKVIAGFLQPGFGHIYLNGEQVTIPSIREADRMHRIGVPGAGVLRQPGRGLEPVPRQGDQSDWHTR